MRKKSKKSFLWLPVIFIVGIIIGFSIQMLPEIEVFEKFVSGSSLATIIVPAVDNEGNGVAVDLLVETKPGNQRILTNIDKLLFWVDTQYSIQTAKDVAEEVTGVNTSNLDIIYSIETDTAKIIGGPSAGAALTIATIAVLQNKTLDKSVMITGTINPDGTIGPVGAVLEKAKAAKDIGARMFLVPEGEGVQLEYRPEEKCQETPGFIYCETNYKQVEIDISETVGIEVVEVSNVEDALNYFF